MAVALEAWEGLSRHGPYPQLSRGGDDLTVPRVLAGLQEPEPDSQAPSLAPLPPECFPGEQFHWGDPKVLTPRCPKPSPSTSKLQGYRCPALLSQALGPLAPQLLAQNPGGAAQGTERGPVVSLFTNTTWGMPEVLMFRPHTRDSNVICLGQDLGVG